MKTSPSDLKQESFPMQKLFKMGMVVAICVKKTTIPCMSEDGHDCCIRPILRVVLDS
jgi:hypothetical protein